MEDDTHTLVDKAQELGDLELAVLLCLVANEHCIIEADAQDIKHAEKELRTLCRSTFGLKSAELRFDKDSSINDFGEGILIQDDERVVTPRIGRNGMQKDSFFSSGDAEIRRRDAERPLEGDGEERRIADVVIVRDLNLACHQVQIQALEVS